MQVGDHNTRTSYNSFGLGGFASNLDVVFRWKSRRIELRRRGRSRGSLRRKGTTVALEGERNAVSRRQNEYYKMNLKSIFLERRR